MAHTPTGCPLATMETESDAAAQRMSAGSRQHPGVSGLGRMRGAPLEPWTSNCYKKVSLQREFVEPEEAVPSLFFSETVCVTPLNNPGGPEGDTVTVAEKLLNTEY